VKIEDLYVSKDWEDGYKIGLRDGKLSIKRKRDIKITPQ
jgi:hypothetical protein